MSHASDMLSDSELSRIGEKLIEDFVEISLVKELAKHLDSMRKAIAIYEASKGQSKP